MTLGEVLRDCGYEVVTGWEPTRSVREASQLLDTVISDVAYDSRKVSRQTLFVAVRGENVDGHDFIGHAVKMGAVAIVGEREPPIHAAGAAGGLPPVFIRVGDSRKALACISSNFCGRPAEALSVVGVTGTNGKTTTTYLIKSILDAWNRGVGLIGTIRYLIKDTEYAATHTTPESLEFQGLLRRMASEGCSHVVTEVSSHALSQRRVDYTRFRCVVFTNLTRDHLDFHGTMELYFDAKRRLFTELLSDAAVINADDEWGRKLIPETKNPLTYGIRSGADITPEDMENTFSGISFVLKQRGKRVAKIESPLIGTANVYNILAAAASAIAMNVPIEAIEAGIRAVTSIPGRLERIDEGQGFLCVVDYAHTPDALERLIRTARELVKRKGTTPTPTLTLPSRGGGQGRGGASRPRIITVFGCGGNRDRGKRPMMGEIATRLSDYVIITSDNPRKEDPLEIIKEIEAGTTANNYLSVPDRKDAITTAVEKAREGDIVIIAGKGHEEYQESGEKRHRFSDGDVAREAIRKRCKADNGEKCRTTETMRH